MPLSTDQRARQRQLANLKRGGSVSPGRPPKHGAYAALSKKHVDKNVRKVAAALSHDAPVRTRDGGLPAADVVVVRQLAETLCRLDNIAEYLDRRGWEDDSGRPRPVLEYEGQLRRHVLDLLRELGMTPKARAALGLDLARSAQSLDLASVLSDMDGDDA